MHKYVIIILTFLSFCSWSQEDSSKTNLFKLIEAIDQNDSINLNQAKYRRHLELTNSFADSLNSREQKFVEKNSDQWNSYPLARKISDSLYHYEANNYSPTALTPFSNQVIQSFRQLRSLALLLEFVRDYNYANDAHQQLIRKKLIHAISVQMQLIADNTQAWYNYGSIEKRWLKGVQVTTANDLFTFSMLQKNNDMDYTGMLKISLITDMFKLDAGRPTQSYQEIQYGGEVFTPFFKDTSLFIKEDTFNVNDRPHACFQYVGLANHGIAHNFKSRWTTDLKVGVIGGRFGYNFQYWLHRDISLSPYPTGWDAQIGNPGRLALQGNVKYERLFFGSQARFNGAGFTLFPSYSGELAIGHYMSYTEVGLNLATRNFRHKNPNQVLPKTQYNQTAERMKKVRGYGDLNVNLRYVIHNTMLEGFGVFKTNEKSLSSFAEPSKYYLSRDRINPFVLFLNLTGGVQFRNINLFYRYSIKSPEFRSQGLILTDNGAAIDPELRWHHYATFGASFIL